MAIERKETFGAFLRDRRKKKEITLRKFAELSGLAPVQMSYMETGQRPAPRHETLVKMAKLLGLDRREELYFFDLAAASFHIPRMSGDLPEYVMGNDIVKIALRTAKDVDATDEEWTEFIARLRKREQEQNGGG